MADTVLCPVCGETNPADMEFCRHCQSRLHPLTGSLKGEDAPIQPGELPTKKVTSELEPVLPQWLRDARQQARESAKEVASKSGQADKAGAANAESDLLAGLASQAKDEDEETPDWLSNITGAPAREKTPASEDSQSQRVELGHANEPQDSSLDERSQQQANASAQDELTEWFKQASSSSEPGGFGLQSRPAESRRDVTPPGESHPEAEARSDEDDLAWLKNLDARAPADAVPSSEPTPPISGGTPDWLTDLRAELPADIEPSSETTPPNMEGTPDWLKNLHADVSGDVQPTSESTPPARDEAPDWLKKLQAENQPPETPEPPASQASQYPSDVPDWLKSFGEAAPEPEPPAPPAQEQPAPDQLLPDWLQSTGSTSELPQPMKAEPAPDATPPEIELPDWISLLGKPQQSAPPESQPSPPAFEADKTPTETPSEQPASSSSAFTEDALAGNDVDAIFASMQTPDWLSAVLPTVPPAEENVPAVQEEEPIGPAELPSWVQAMRPVESAMAVSAGAEQDNAPEDHGPLAGLQGVLPAIPGAAAPSSKPKAHSIKLDATEQQQAHAALLEKILAAETSPIPMRSSSLLRSQRVLRWLISLALLITLGSVIFTQTQRLPLPGAVPNETISAIRAVEAIPVDAPVLLVFDYQPSTVGEMEATGGSLLDHLLLLKHPHLALLSTSPTGPALAERFMSTTLADRTRDYVRGVEYVDLGYLPGGLAGVYDFAQNPSATMPLGADSKPVWESAVLAPVTRFSDFAAVIVLTDTVESGRVWIEQTSQSRGKSLLVIAASAQAGPMLLPYVDSGQVNGLISGMNGAVGAEQANNGLPGFIRRYWDAYSVGLYLAVLLILAGGLWNFWLGIQDRRAEAVG